MNATELRTIQAPLKQRYRDDPTTARIVSRATGEIDQSGIASIVRSRQGTVTAGLHEAAGGDGSKACSGDMLLEALIACAGVTLSAVATMMGVTIRKGSITAEGVWDARGTLAVDKTAPVGVSEVNLHFDLDTDADARTVERLVESTERYCVVLQTLRNPPRISTAIG